MHFLNVIFQFIRTCKSFFTIPTLVKFDNSFMDCVNVIFQFNRSFIRFVTFFTRIFFIIWIFAFMNTAYVKPEFNRAAKSSVTNVTLEFFNTFMNGIYVVLQIIRPRKGFVTPAILNELIL